MEAKNKQNDYWFTIEPYVFVGITEKEILLYNTLDGVSIESNNKNVIDLIYETLQRDNCGVVLLTHEQYNQIDIKMFIDELREKYMGDIIDVSLSKGKPIQLHPYYNFLKKNIIAKNVFISENKNMLENLSEISIHLGSQTNVKQIIPVLKSTPKISVFNIVGNSLYIIQNKELLTFLEEHSSKKSIHCSYDDLCSIYESLNLKTFFYKLLVQLPVDFEKLKKTIEVLTNESLSYEYIFNVSSKDDCLYVERLVNEENIDKYTLNPIYTGNNLSFFKENVYLSKEDILSTRLSIKDFFIRQSINTYNFGKLNIMPNGDVYANINHPKLGNIYTHSIYEIVQNEMEKGMSWFLTRDQSPCNTCVYQWLCPSPSNLEIKIGKPNLCLVK